MTNNWKRKFIILTAGQAVSLIGSSAVQFALIWWLAEETSSPMILGFAGLAAFLPMTFLSPFAGVAADKYNRKMICITADLFLGLLALIYAVFLYLYDLPAWTAVLLLFMRGIGGTFHQPAIQSIIPQLVPKEYLVKANGWSQLMSSGSFMLGPVIGAALYAAVPLSAILLTDLLGALLACGALAIIAVPRLDHLEVQNTNFKMQFREGMDVYRSDKLLLRIFVVQTVCMIFYMPLSSFYPLMTSNYFNLSAWHGSIVELSFALGMLASAFLFGSVIKVKKKIQTAYLGILGIGITSALCGILPAAFGGWILFTVICGLMGAFGNVYSIPLTAYMQETIPPEKMGRAFSLFALAGSLTMPVGLLFASPIAELVGVRIWFLISGVIITLIAVVPKRN